MARRRKRFESPRPMAPKARGAEVCGEHLRTADDGRVEQVCIARPHGEDERHRPGPWTDTKEAAA